MPTPFPQELLDHIIYHLGAPDGNGNVEVCALKACSMTSWSMLLPSRRQIFAKVCIVQSSGDQETHLNNFDFNKTRLSNLLQILEDDPTRINNRGQASLASCVRSLELHLAPTRSKYAMTDPSRVRADQRRWDDMHSSLPGVLALLDHVETFRLRFPSQISCMWGLVGSSITSSLLQFIRSPYLTTLEFSAVSGLPASLVIHCPNLQNLMLEKIFDEHINYAFSELQALECVKDPLPEPPYNQPSLQRLSITAAYAFAKTLLKHPKNARIFGGLRELDLIGHGTTFDLEWNILELASSTITRLRLTRGYIDPGAYTSQICRNEISYAKEVDPAIAKTLFGRLDLSCLPNLQHLEVISTPNNHPEFFAPTQILDLLKKASSPTSVVSLYVKFSWRYITGNPSFLEAIFSCPEWAAFNVLLTGSRYPALKNVSLDFHLDIGQSSYSPDFLKSMVKTVNDMLPRFESSKSTNFEYNVNLL